MVPDGFWSGFGVKKKGHSFSTGRVRQESRWPHVGRFRAVIGEGERLLSRTASGFREAFHAQPMAFAKPWRQFVFVLVGGAVWYASFVCTRTHSQWFRKAVAAVSIYS